MASQNNSNINPGLYDYNIMFSDLKDDNGLNLNYQPYKYSDYNDCNFAHDSDKNNLLQIYSLIQNITREMFLVLRANP